MIGWRGADSVLWIVARLVEALAFAAAAWAVVFAGMLGGFLGVTVFVFVMHELKGVR